ncbi:hypothetical protein AMK21_12165 [Streptomyces sp. CB00316]|uniref:DUF4259 domain-containing protein n=1 Tax=unclassified Streptomyces TaxID=2593676 RepID=UPI00093B1548|nr:MULTISPECIES: DUF4259 domain-containing protein [unclassified Streptomyces]MBT2380656.1 DUF4259 domain-containing protein [Streptomyces sp. ISL-111]OKJ20696.1 hypothetical protein AMK21_12165 [Streptomyces sp. CB00316]
MGAWDIGHFDNDTAADFGGSVDDADPEKKADVLRAVLAAAAGTGPQDYLDSGEEAVAAAALVAAQCPGGEPVTTAYGPKDPLPPLPADLRPLAVRALDRLTGANAEPLDLWADAGAEEEWLAGIAALRAVLAAAPVE